jgi:hypothetical protein
MILLISWLVSASILRIRLFQSPALNNLLDHFSLLRKNPTSRKKTRMTHSRIAMLLTLLLLKSLNPAGKIHKSVKSQAVY